jgi:hypothetical protein
LRVCASGTFIPQACMGSTPACLNGQCVACTPNATACQGNALQTCAANGTWSSQSCAYGCLNGACRPSTYGTIGLAGTVTCTATLTCSTSTPCCYDQHLMSGTCATSCTLDPFYTVIPCDGPNDCPTGQVCCAYSDPGGIHVGCFATQCPTGQLLCDPAAPSCPAGSKCTSTTVRQTPVYACN